MARKLYELYQVILDEFDGVAKYNTGLCSKIRRLSMKGYLSTSEYYLLLDNLPENRPRVGINVEFTLSKSYEGYVYWWYNTIDGDIERKKFLQHLIYKYKQTDT